VRGRRIAAWLSAPLGYLRHRHCLVAQWPKGPVSLSPDVALVCHFDPEGTVPAHLLRYLGELASSGFSVVVVSNSGTLRPAAMAALQTVCAAVLVRRNRGWDFAAWREALERLDLPKPETRRLLLANDSVYGPVTPLAPLLARMNDTADAWGMTDSAELGWHLQSYFLLVGSAVLHSPAWRRFWRGVRPMRSKLLVVMWYEIGFSRCLHEAGFRLCALFPHASVTGEPARTRKLPETGFADPEGTVTNPTLAAWQALRAAGFPFVKRTLLRNNPVMLAEPGLDPPDGATVFPGRQKIP
jgi:Rhamnan synthesis protein F